MIFFCFLSPTFVDFHHIRSNPGIKGRRKLSGDIKLDYEKERQVPDARVITETQGCAAENLPWWTGGFSARSRRLVFILIKVSSSCAAFTFISWGPFVWVILREHEPQGASTKTCHSDVMHRKYISSAESSDWLTSRQQTTNLCRCHIIPASKHVTVSTHTKKNR